MADKLPNAIWSGDLVIGDLKLKCYVLDDGRRVIDKDSFEQFFAQLGDMTQEDLETIARFIGKKVWP